MKTMALPSERCCCGKRKNLTRVSLCVGPCLSLSLSSVTASLSQPPVAVSEVYFCTAQLAKQDSDVAHGTNEVGKQNTSKKTPWVDSRRIHESARETRTTPPPVSSRNKPLSWRLSSGHRKNEIG